MALETGDLEEWTTVDLADFNIVDLWHDWRTGFRRARHANVHGRDKAYLLIERDPSPEMNLLYVRCGDGPFHTAGE